MTVVRVLAAVIRDGGCYLLGRRPSHKRHGGMWEFPGGKVEGGESDLAALRRELREELAVAVQGVSVPRFTAQDPGSEYRIEFVPAEISGEPRPLEHTDLRWCTLAEMEGLDLAPADRAFAAFLLGGGGASEAPGVVTGAPVRNAPGGSRGKAQRWFDLIVCLIHAGKAGLTFAELQGLVEGYRSDGEARAAESVRRTFERDKDELRKQAIPIEMDGAEDSARYRLASPELFLPSLRVLPDGATAAGAGLQSRSTLRLTPADAALAIEALRIVEALPAFPLSTAATSAIRKLHVDPAFPDLHAPVFFLPRPGAEDLRGPVSVLSDALAALCRVEFVYRSIHRDERKHRRVEPWAVYLQQGYWYLAGQDLDAGAQRLFRVDRMEEIRADGKGASYAIPEAFSLASLAARMPWELGDEPERVVTATVSFTPARAEWAERNGFGRAIPAGDAEVDAEVEVHPVPGCVLRAFRVTQPDPFLRWILPMGTDARILSPPELIDGFQTMVEAAWRVSSALEEGGADGGD